MVKPEVHPVRAAAARGGKKGGCCGVVLGLRLEEPMPAPVIGVLALMAEGRSNSAIAAELVVSGGAVEKHVASIFTRLGLPPDESDNRRVLAVLHYLGSPA